MMRLICKAWTRSSTSGSEGRGLTYRRSDTVLSAVQSRSVFNPNAQVSCSTRLFIIENNDMYRRSRNNLAQKSRVGSTFQSCCSRFVGSGMFINTPAISGGDTSSIRHLHILLMQVKLPVPLLITKVETFVRVAVSLNGGSDSFCFSKMLQL